MQPLSFSTGTLAALGSVPGLVEAQPLTHKEALELDEVPEQTISLVAQMEGQPWRSVRGHGESQYARLGCP